MTTKKKVLENSFLYIFSSLLVKAIGFLLLPIYTLFLSPEEYGITNLVVGFVNVANFIVAFSLYSAAIRYTSDYKDDRQKLKEFYGTIISFILISGTFFFILGFVFKDFVMSVFFEGIDFYPIVLIALMSIVFVSLHSIHQSILQGTQKGRKLTKLNLIVFALTATLKIIFIGVLKLGSTGFLLAQLLIDVGYFVYMIYDLRKADLITWTINLSILSETLKYSIPLMPHNLSTRIASLASRIFINTNGTIGDVGLYSISMQFGNLIDVVQVAVNNAFQPWFYDMMNSNRIDNKKEAVQMSNVLLVFYSVIYMLIGLFSQEVIMLMASVEYVSAWKVIPILVVGFSVKSIYYFYVNIVMFYKKAARKLFIATIIGSLTDIFMAYILVPLYGMYGSAIAFVIAKIVIVSIVVYLSKLYDDIGYKILKMIGIISTSLLFMAIGLYFSYTRYPDVFNFANFFYKLVILIIYFVVLFFTNKKMIIKIIESKVIQNMFKRNKLKRTETR